MARLDAFRVIISALAHDDEEAEAVLLLEFDDGSALTADLDLGPEPGTWVSGVSRGQIQLQIEEIVSLALAANLPAALPGSDRRIAQAILDLLGEFAAAPAPPRSDTREAATWLWRKVDLLLDEAAKTGGKAAGALAVGSVGYSLQRHAPALSEKLRELLDIAG